MLTYESGTTVLHVTKNPSYYSAMADRVLHHTLYQVCQRPDITNGKLITEDPEAQWIKSGETGTVTCEQGYTLSGVASVRCDEGKLVTPSGVALSATCEKVL